MDPTVAAQWPRLRPQWAGMRPLIPAPHRRCGKLACCREFCLTKTVPPRRVGGPALGLCGRSRAGGRVSACAQKRSSADPTVQNARHSGPEEKSAPTLRRPRRVRRRPLAVPWYADAAAVDRRLRARDQPRPTPSASCQAKAARAAAYPARRASPLLIGLKARPTHHRAGPNGPPSGR